MNRLLSSVSWVAAAVGMVLTWSCTDLGDSSAIPSAGTEDATTSISSSSEDSSTASAEDGALDDASESDGDDSGAVGTSGDEAGLPDASTDDVFVVDAGVDATIEDASLPDTGLVAEDAALADATLADTGAADGGGSAGADAGGDSAAGLDAGGAADTGGDAAQGGNLVPCTAAGQTHCVLCQFNNGAAGTLPNTTQLCTPTEAALVAHDIATGQATTAGPDPDQSCYACAAEQGCLDDSEFDDKDHECEDLSGAASAAECEGTLACILGSSCGFASGALSTCYCGTAAVSGACAAVGASNAANGACKAPEATGLGFSVSDGLDILKNFTSTTLPSGVANNIFQCAASNSCTNCLH